MIVDSKSRRGPTWRRAAPTVELLTRYALAEQESVSRGTARSTPALLADEGLLEVVPGQGWRVGGGAVGKPSGTTAWGRVAVALRQRLVAGEFAADRPTRLPALGQER